MFRVVLGITALIYHRICISHISAQSALIFTSYLIILLGRSTSTMVTMFKLRRLLRPYSNDLNDFLQENTLSPKWRRTHNRMANLDRDASRLGGLKIRSLGEIGPQYIVMSFLKMFNPCLRLRECCGAKDMRAGDECVILGVNAQIHRIVEPLSRR